ncbi:MAG: hypothetical protein IT176_05315 [Acidobacteria bacterium]|nr:hypothetical protein [Acidobacteriota bacterium]
MRDLLAGLVALLLLGAAASLATTLHDVRQRRRRRFEAERARGRAVVAEVPTGEDLVLVTEDEDGFYYGGQAVAKHDIALVRVLINGAPIAEYVSRRRAHERAARSAGFEDRPEGIAADRWDVEIEASGGTLRIACGAIRERVSQELARSIFDRVKAALERLDALTIPSPGSGAGD